MVLVFLASSTVLHAIVPIQLLAFFATPDSDTTVLLNPACHVDQVVSAVLLVTLQFVTNVEKAVIMKDPPTLVSLVHQLARPVLPLLPAQHLRVD